MSILENPHIDTDAFLGILRLLRRVFGGFDAEDGVPLAGRFAFDCDGLNIGVIGQLTVESERDFTEFREPQAGPTARILELEAGLTVGEAAVLVRCFPLERPNAVAVLFVPT